MEARRAARRLVLAAGLLAAVADGQGKVYKKAPPPKCPGTVPVDGIEGDVHIIPTGWVGIPAPMPLESRTRRAWSCGPRSRAARTSGRSAQQGTIRTSSTLQRISSGRDSSSRSTCLALVAAAM
ncbi:unnamed protein product [Prorocentrum cordatum]|uniref:Uncharacterized protein n=1 Tax=Prorocentrum cordatum TaxID=2364126 RepID=A0ABN9TTD4_9DINO|nr:unnamed protein product [Polarella glacialis]